MRIRVILEKGNKMRNKEFKIAAFDFDATIINDNSDTYINSLLSDKYSEEAAKSCSEVAQGDYNQRRFVYPEHIESVYKASNWPSRMNAVFDYIHARFNLSYEDILTKLREIRIDESMKYLLRRLKEQNYELIIVSDANSLFIETILEQNGLLDLFESNKILTNPTCVDEAGRIVITPYYYIHKYDKQPYDCSFCVKHCAEPSICKRELLREYIFKKTAEQQLESDTKPHVIYVGDGRNDYCPGLLLDESDLYFPRRGFNLSKVLANKENYDRIRAKIKFWSSADEIVQELKL